MSLSSSPSISLFQNSNLKAPARGGPRAYFCPFLCWKRCPRSFPRSGRGDRRAIARIAVQRGRGKIRPIFHHSPASCFFFRSTSSGAAKALPYLSSSFLLSSRLTHFFFSPRLKTPTTTGTRPGRAAPALGAGRRDLGWRQRSSSYR